ncbi:hypothetical protein [Aureimonas leprariae]|uniref:Uncharacterized protein n=1 Tax=Plantimonas leprariae TaxID=2615207 RepID=A0A7V7PKZ6_9HYPH|nr:hypothetical protein [Aureimonas leprariae]KAB0676725.1 hypothetical protein F6X38_20715 [Aureimonas leprariae]
MKNDPKGTTGEATPEPKREPDYAGLCANLVAMIDCTSWLFIENAGRAQTEKGEVYQLPIRIGDQLTAILILARDAAQAELAEALR